MFRITIRAGGISPYIGPRAAQDIENEFHERRQWHKQVACSFSAGTLTLVALNDFDRDGRALSDEFSDCLCAYIPLDGMSDDGDFEVIAVETC
jgi:hypothetical protein